MQVKVEFVPDHELVAKDYIDGLTWHGYTVDVSFPHDPHALVTLPGEWSTAETEDWLRGRQQAGELIQDVIDPNDPENNQYGFRLWWNQYEASPFIFEQKLTQAIRDTYELHGISVPVLQRGRYGRDVPIAILDTGVYIGHVGFDGIQASGDLTDNNGHGTAMASIVLGQWGIASQSPLVSYAVLDGFGRGSEASVANGYRAAADAGIPIITASLGGSGSSVIDAACNYAIGKGSLLTAAAGNGGPTQLLGSPARACQVIVMAHDRQRQRASFTAGPWGLEKCIGANGVSIDCAQNNTRSGVITVSGTSPATPHIAAIAALHWSASLALGRTPIQARQAALDYIFSHRQVPPDSWGSCVMALDFGESDRPPTRHWTRFYLELTDNFGNKDYATGNVDLPVNN